MSGIGRTALTVLISMACAGALSGCGGRDDARAGDGGLLDASISSEGGPAGDGATTDGAGPACDTVPALPAAELTDCSGGGTPTPFVPCGGAIPEGTWELTGVCETMPFPVDAIPSAMICSAIDPATVEASRTVRGSLTFGGGELRRVVDSELLVRFDAPSACGHDCDCEAWAAAISAFRMLPVTCDPTCDASSACACTVDLSTRTDSRMTFMTVDTQIQADDPVTGPTVDYRVDYCVAGDALSLHDAHYDGFTPSNLEYRRRAPLDFETCDGFDDDEDGVVDESPTECGGCLVEGVCGAGASRACTAGAWECTYVSAGHEEDEATCDGLDNDCNGVVDDAEGCCVTAADCDDGNDCTEDTCGSSVCQNTVPGDADGDGFAAGTGTGSCGNDCNDADPDVFPGQTRFFAEPHTDPTTGATSFDYDCDGTEQPRTTRTASRCTTIEPPRTCPTCVRTCAGSGWVGSVPACGAAGDIRTCDEIPSGSCTGASSTNPGTQTCR